MEISHDVQLVIIGALIGGVFSLLAAFAGAHHEEWIEGRRKTKESDEAFEFTPEIVEKLKKEVVIEVLAAIEKSDGSVNTPLP